MIKKVIAVIVIIILVVLYFSFTVVSQGQQGVLLHAGKPVITRGNIAETLQPGLHIHAPWLETVELVDMSTQSDALTMPQLLTADQQAINVNVLINWKVQEAGAYYQASTDNAQMVESAIKKAVMPVVATMIKQNSVAQLLTAAQNQQLVNAILKAATAAALPFCVQVQSVQLASIELSDSAVTNTDNVMKARFAGDAADITAKGDQQALQIRTQADQTAALSVEQMQVKAAQIRAQGDAEAGMIYGKAYQQDPGFYEFYRSLQAYQNSFNSKQDVIVLQPKGEFFKYFNPSSVTNP